MRFNVYFERILNKKLLFSYRNNDIITARMLRWFRGMYKIMFPRETLDQTVQFVCFLYIF